MAQKETPVKRVDIHLPQRVCKRRDEKEDGSGGEDPGEGAVATPPRERWRDRKRGREKEGERCYDISDPHFVIE